MLAPSLTTCIRQSWTLTLSRARVLRSGSRTRCDGCHIPDLVVPSTTRWWLLAGLVVRFSQLHVCVTTNGRTNDVLLDRFRCCSRRPGRRDRTAVSADLARPLRRLTTACAKNGGCKRPPFCCCRRPTPT